ncbi:MAG: ISAzo13 family transposase, partial [Bacteroidota bacterium]|nr:ISAzo13 family transposase [Bacteroidota bacterium]
ETVINLISKTTTAKGLKVKCRLDRRKYPIGRKVTKKEMDEVNLKRDVFHGEWNYVIQPNNKPYFPRI